MNVEGKVCVVTGASSGIGAATATLLAGRGATVVLAARRTERIEALAAELPNAIAVTTDVTSDADRQTLFGTVAERFGCVDVLVNNAGQGLHVPVMEIAAGDMRAVFDLNVVAPLACMQLAVPLMKAGGAVIHVSSMTSLMVIPGLAGYAATKSASNLISYTARKELADSGISVSVVYPPITATEFHSHLRAGEMRGGPHITAVAPDVVAAAILLAIESGAEHVAVRDTPRTIDVKTSFA